jgi:hypothetical protein
MATTKLIINDLYGKLIKILFSEKLIKDLYGKLIKKTFLGKRKQQNLNK